MKTDELTRKLNSVGKSAFVQNFDLFESYFKGQLSKAECIEKIVRSGVSNESGAAIRCSNAILIFKNKQEIEALKMVIQSKRLPYEISVKAVELFTERNT